MGRNEEEAPAGSPAWMATFSDLMNLLLCFFVLLFSMSSVDAAKYEQVVNSLSSAFSVLSSSSGSTITEGTLMSSGISQLPEYANYFGTTLSDGDGDGETDTGAMQEDDGEDDDGGQTNESETGANGETGADDGSQGNNGEETGAQGEDDQEMSEKEAEELMEQQQLAESEEMSETVEALTTEYGIQDQVEVDFNGQYVRLTLNGALLFDSGSAELRSEAEPLVTKLAQILNQFSENQIMIEGHTDNVPISSAKYEDNDVLSMYRALYVANFIRANSTIDPGNIVSAGRGDYYPIADNSTAEGRARNRRVEIKIYNSYNSDLASE